MFKGDFNDFGLLNEPPDTQFKQEARVVLRMTGSSGSD